MEHNYIYYLLHFLVVGLIVIAVDHKRTSECVYSVWSWNGIVQMILVIVGVVIIQTIAWLPNGNNRFLESLIIVKEWAIKYTLIK